MKMEFSCRQNKVLPPDRMDTIDDEVNAMRLVDKTGNFDADRAKAKIIDEDGEFVYVPWVIDLADVADFNKFDNHHTRIFKYSNLILILHIAYEDFKAIYQLTTGRLVASSNDFLMQKPKKSK